MESEKLIVESDIKKNSFMAHLFNFDDDTKNQLMNIFQYTVLAIIPVVMLNKGIAHLIPEVDDEKPSYMLTLELLGQAILIFFGMFLIHRFVTYFRTYSGTAYAPFHTTNVIILFLVIAASFQTRIGEKTNILIDRLFDVIEGRSTLSGETKKDEHKAPAKNQGGHPHAQQQQHHIPQHQPSRADVSHAGTTNISQLQANERAPDFNSMFSGPNNPLQNAQSPGMMQEGFSEPVAANEMAGSSWNAF
jgi:hypothetical protein